LSDGLAGIAALRTGAAGVESRELVICTSSDVPGEQELPLAVASMAAASIVSQSLFQMRTSVQYDTLTTSAETQHFSAT
jgi:hypothetical protein